MERYCDRERERDTQRENEERHDEDIYIDTNTRWKMKKRAPFAGNNEGARIDHRAQQKCVCCKGDTRREVATERQLCREEKKKKLPVKSKIEQKLK